ncbi:hypothetical protein [Massilia aquatica]|uniref:Uncharacterized protein n=1 Tax=Massilia aquatica TaxID=2609000 RepID=A0ABX0MGE8_9BURK|nr:hypothetical protein [Massilia aquatica]NHZ42961.1 hypothetical protein [Massilia aquatica]
MININKNEFLTTLLAIIETNYHDVGFLNCWAIGVMGKLSVHEYWLEQLEFCQTLACSENAIKEELFSSGINVETIFPRLLIGLLYLRLQKDEIGRVDFERELVDISDAYDMPELDIEYVNTELSREEWDPDFRQLLDGMAHESLDKLRQVEELVM